MFDQPSIQSFYGRTAKSVEEARNDKVHMALPPPGSGFTTQESRPLPAPSSMPRFKPRGEYRATDIADIQTGPGSIKIVGRAVNMMHKTQDSGPDGRKASGFMKTCIRDDTGIITVQSLVQIGGSSYG